MRNPNTTKYDYGHALLIAGAYGRMGCAILAARAALRSGCGLITVHLPSRCVDAMQAAFPEAMVSIDSSPTLFSTTPMPLDRYNALAVGPGLGTDDITQQALLQLLSLKPKGTPLVLDADALNILALHPEWLALCSGAVITPHAKEYERLFGDADPAEVAHKHNLIVVKKAHHTRIYSPDGRLYENRTGNAGMATAGSGDVLTGILLGILAHRGHKEMFSCVCKAVEIHGKSGDIAIGKQTESSLIASDLVENLRLLSTDGTTDYN